MKVATAFAFIDLGLRLLIEAQELKQLNATDEQALKNKIREIQSGIKTLKGTPVEEIT